MYEILSAETIEKLNAIKGKDYISTFKDINFSELEKLKSYATRVRPNAYERKFYMKIKHVAIPTTSDIVRMEYDLLRSSNHKHIRSDYVNISINRIWLHANKPGVLYLFSDQYDRMVMLEPKPENPKYKKSICVISLKMGSVTTTIGVVDLKDREAGIQTARTFFDQCLASTKYKYPFEECLNVIETKYIKI